MRAGLQIQKQIKKNQKQIQRQIQTPNSKTAGSANTRYTNTIGWRGHCPRRVVRLSCLAELRAGTIVPLLEQLQRKLGTGRGKSTELAAWHVRIGIVDPDLQ
jgi:hypothetical protein